MSHELIRQAAGKRAGRGDQGLRHGQPCGGGGSQEGCGRGCELKCGRLETGRKGPGPRSDADPTKASVTPAASLGDTWSSRPQVIPFGPPGHGVQLNLGGHQLKEEKSYTRKEM